MSACLVGQTAHAFSAAAAEVHDSDRIHMRGLTFYGHHGVLPEVGAACICATKLGIGWQHAPFSLIGSTEHTQA